MEADCRNPAEGQYFTARPFLYPLAPVSQSFAQKTLKHLKKTH